MKEAAGLMEEMVIAYNKYIEDAKIALTSKMVNTFVPIGVGIASALIQQTPVDPSKLVDPVLELMNTPHGDVKITKRIKQAFSPEPVDTGPLAMFYTINKALTGNWFEKAGWKFESLYR